MSLSENDQRTLEKLLGRISLYEGTELPLPGLISDTEWLLAQLDSNSQPLKDALLSSWGVLEDVYAAQLDLGAVALEEEDQQSVKTAVASLRRIAEAALSGVN